MLNLQPRSDGRGGFDGVLTHDGLLPRRNRQDAHNQRAFGVGVVLRTSLTSSLLTFIPVKSSCFAGFALNWGDELTSHELYTHFSEGIELLNDSGIFFLIGVVSCFIGSRKKRMESAHRLQYCYRSCPGKTSSLTPW